MQGVVAFMNTALRSHSISMTSVFLVPEECEKAMTDAVRPKLRSWQTGLCALILFLCMMQILKLHDFSVP
jgi:hypothetical protein